MKLKTIKGNLLDLAEQGEFDIIVHGCNCFHTMGAGIARQIAKRWPIVLEIDSQCTDYGDYQKLGNTTSAKIKREDKSVLRIINAYTQYEPGPNLDHPALVMCLKKIHFGTDKKTRIGLPMIGCGIAGGDWEVVSRVIWDNLAYDRNVTIVTL